MMRALLLVGGKATRLRPLTERTPKAMTPLLGRPFLEHLLAWLADHEVRDVTMCLGFLPDPIRDYFGDGSRFGVTLRYATEETPLGSGGAIKQLEPELAETFFALNGDIFTTADLSAMLADHRRHGATVTIALTRVDDPSQYGVVALDAAGWIERFVEKPPPDEAPSDRANAGIWLFEPAALARITPGCFTMVEHDLFPDLAREHRLLGHPIDAYWMDAGTPDRYLQLHRDLLEGRAKGPLPLAERTGWPGLRPRSPVGVEDGPPPILATGARIEGPVVLDAGVALAADARVRGPASIGARSRLGAGSVVAGSVLWPDCVIGDGADIAGSVLARGCVIGAGARLRDCVLGDGVTVAAGRDLMGVRANPGEAL
jgi:mannose-1-phosphate guanylyltransferase